MKKEGLQTAAAWTPAERRVLRRLSTPARIQDFLDTCSYNHEVPRETCRSPREVLRRREAHCIEGALFAVAALQFHGKRAYLLDLAAKGDHDHVVCVYKEGSYWGAISQSKFHSLGYRDPIFRTLRELVLTYFSSYHNYRGQKSLSTYSRPVGLARFERSGWMTSKDDLWNIGNYLFTVKHYALVPSTLRGKLRHVPAAAQYADTAQPPAGWKNRKPAKGH